MTDFRLKSSIRRKIFSSFERVSSFRENIYISISIISKIDNGSYFDFSLLSGFFNRNGDLSIKSSYAIGGDNDLSFKSSYKTSYIAVDYGIKSTFNESIFTELGFISKFSKVFSVDYDLESSFSKSKFNQADRKSLIRKINYRDFYSKTSFIYAPENAVVSYGFKSTFKKLDRNAPPNLTDLDGFTLGELFSIKVSSGSLSSALFDVGDFQMIFDYSLGDVIADAGNISVVTIRNYADGYYNSGRAVFLKEVSLSGIMSGEIELEYELGILEDLTSAIIEMNIRRDIVDYEDNLGDHINLGIHFKELDIRKSKSEISIPFDNILKLFSDSRYDNLVSLPQEDDFVENSVLLSDYVQGFYVDIEVSKFNLINFNGGEVTFETISNDGNSRIADFSNVGIKLPIEETKFKLIGVVSTYVHHITIRKLNLGFLSIDTKEVVPDFLMYFDNLKESISELSNAYRYIANPKLLSIEGSHFDGMVVPDNSKCYLNGIMAKEYTTSDKMSGFLKKKSNTIAYLTPSLLVQTDLSDVSYQTGVFRYNTLQDFSGIEYKISANMTYNGYISSFEDMLVNIKPQLFFTNGLEDITFIDEFSYYSREDLDGVLTKDSRFTAELMFDGQDLISSNMEFLVVNYDN